MTNTPTYATPCTKKFPPAPNTAIITPPSAGPMTFMRLNPPELSAIALASSALGTTLGIRLCLTGSLNVQPIPVINVNTKMCHTCHPPETNKPPLEDRGQDQKVLSAQHKFLPVHAVGGDTRHGAG